MITERMADFFPVGDLSVPAIVGETEVRGYLDVVHQEALRIAGSDVGITFAVDDLHGVPAMGTHIAVNQRLYAAKHVLSGVVFASVTLEERNWSVKTIGNTTHKTSVGGLQADILGFSAALVLFDLGDWFDGTHTFGLEHSADGVTWSRVSAGSIVGSIPTLDSEASQRRVVEVTYTGGLRYLRAVVDIADSDLGAIYGVIIVRSSGLSIVGGA